MQESRRTNVALGTDGGASEIASPGASGPAAGRAPGRWLPRSASRAMSPAPLLFCLPCAGSGASMYRGWGDALLGGFEVVPIHLPGREARMAERPFDRIGPLVVALADSLGPQLEVGCPFALFGHSMGALIVFELARELRRRDAPLPVHLFASGARAPQMPDRHPPTYDLGDREFLQALQRWDGLPQPLLDHDELMRLLLPTMRADLRLVEMYQYREESPLTCPITAYAGRDDPMIVREEVMGWAHQTAGPFAAQFFAGGHFFLAEQRSLLLDSIGKRLALSLMV